MSRCEVCQHDDDPPIGTLGFIGDRTVGWLRHHDHLIHGLAELLERYMTETDTSLADLQAAVQAQADTVAVAVTDLQSLEANVALLEQHQADGTGIHPADLAAITTTLRGLTASLTAALPAPAEPVPAPASSGVQTADTGVVPSPPATVDPTATDTATTASVGAPVAQPDAVADPLAAPVPDATPEPVVDPLAPTADPAAPSA